MDIGYPVSSITRHRDTGTWMLAAHFDDRQMSLELRHTEDESLVLDADGRLLTRGQMTADIPILLQDEQGETLRLDRIEIDGQLQLYLPSQPMVPGLPYSEAEALRSGGRAASPEEIAMLPGLATGTLIATDDGPQPIDWLRPGDRVLTRDNGYQPLLWLGQQTMPRRAPPDTWPLKIAAGQLGPDLPDREITLTPQTGILLAGPELEMWFAETEMFAQAQHVVPDAAPQEGRRLLYSMLFDRPEVVLAEGLWVSSVHADPGFFTMLPNRVRSTLAARIAPAHAEAARAWLADWETAMFTRERRRQRDRIAA